VGKAVKKITASFYRATGGSEPVREWLLKLNHDDRRTIGTDIQKVEFGWPIGMPYSRSLGKGLYEVRSNISDKRIARVIFFILRNRMILLHGFVKKTQKIPNRDLKLSEQRMKEVLDHDTGDQEQKSRN
jgi:phage-related protein